MSRDSRLSRVNDGRENGDSVDVHYTDSVGRGQVTNVPGYLRVYFGTFLRYVYSTWNPRGQPRFIKDESFYIYYFVFPGKLP